MMMTWVMITATMGVIRSTFLSIRYSLEVSEPMFRPDQPLRRMYEKYERIEVYRRDIEGTVKTRNHK